MWWCLVSGITILICYNNLVHCQPPASWLTRDAAVHGYMSCFVYVL
jgi:hypothetical protein